MEKYRNYEQQGFNFGGPLRFDYDDELKKLFIQSSPFHIENFFNPSLIDGKEAPSSTITNVTAIIGENGTGKSSLLEYMIRLFSFDLYREESSQLIVFRTESDEYVIYSKNMEFDLINPLELIITNKVISELDTEDFPLVIYYTNIFDARRMPDNQRYYDISTNRILENYFANEGDRNLSKYHMNETEQQLRFIKNTGIKHSEKIPFKLPEKISVTVIQPEDFLDYGNSKWLINNFEDFIQICHRDLKSYYDDHSIPKKWRYKLATRILNHILQELEFFKPNRVVLNILNEIVFKVPHFLKLENSFPLEGHEYINKKFSLLIQIAQKELKPNDNMLRILTNSYHLLELITDVKDNLSERDDSIDIPLNNKTLDKLINYYHLSIRHDNYLQFSWPGLSSGELALLNLFSRFYRILGSVNRRKGRQNVMVLIDEGEALFHPQWQKQLVSNLVAFFSDIFQNKLIQIVLTSNSPFIASDLPKTNVIFLKNIDGRTVSINELDDLHQTFAANIHTLLSQSFFLHDGLIGTFARKKINEVISLLVNQGREEIMEKKQEIEALISIIGEPIIRTKLTQLLQEKITLHGLSLEDRVAALEARLAQQDGGNRT